MYSRQGQILEFYYTIAEITSMSVGIAMFGMGIFEILVILIVAVIFLGPEKLPQAMVDIAKFFKAVKKTINDAKDTFDRELQIDEIKKEAFDYKNSFESGLENVTKNIQLKEVDGLFNENKEIPFKTKKLQEPIQIPNLEAQTHLNPTKSLIQKKRGRKPKNSLEEKSLQNAQNSMPTQQSKTNKTPTMDTAIETNNINKSDLISTNKRIVRPKVGKPIGFKKSESKAKNHKE